MFVYQHHSQKFSIPVPCVLNKQVPIHHDRWYHYSRPASPPPYHPPTLSTTPRRPQNNPATTMPHRNPQSKTVSFSKKDTIIPIAHHKRPKTTPSDPKTQRAQLKTEIAKLEHEFLKTRKSREANELKYEKSHNMRRKQEQARMMAYVEGCRMREAVLLDLLSDAKSMLKFVEEHDRLQNKGYARGIWRGWSFGGRGL